MSLDSPRHPDVIASPRPNILPSGRAALALVRGIGILFVIASLAKANAPQDTREAVLAVAGVLDGVLGFAEEAPSASASIIAAIAASEFFLGGWLLIAPRSRAARILTTSMLLVFCIALGLLLTLDNPPSCGCFGALRVWTSARVEHWFGLGRDLLCIAIVLPLPSRR